MDIMKSLISSIQQIGYQLGGIGNWFTKTIIEIDGVAITPLSVLLPATLIILLGVLIVRFFTL